MLISGFDIQAHTQTHTLKAEPSPGSIRFLTLHKVRLVFSQFLRLLVLVWAPQLEETYMLRHTETGALDKPTLSAENNTL